MSMHSAAVILFGLIPDVNERIFKGSAFSTRGVEDYFLRPRNPAEGGGATGEKRGRGGGFK